MDAQPSPQRRLSLVSVLVPDYDEAIAWYVDVLGFELVENTQLSDTKRWVIVSPGAGSALLLAKVANAEQQAAIGQQSGGRVFLFLQTDNFWYDHATYKSRGVQFQEEPRTEEYGTVAVFSDKFGNLWDLIELNK